MIHLQFTSDGTLSFKILQLQDSLLYARAYWVSESIIAWNVDVGNGSCYLYSSGIAALSIQDGEIIGLDMTNYIPIDVKENSVLYLVFPVTGHDMKIKLDKDNGGLSINVMHLYFCSD